jgi:hypothetical protein
LAVAPEEADEIFVSQRGSRWREITTVLRRGEDVFIPDMSRSDLESLRTVSRYRGYGDLRSRLTTINNRKGRLLRLKPFKGGKAPARPARRR